VLELGTAYGNITANVCNQCPTANVYTVNAPAEEQTGTRVTYKLSKDQIGRVYRQYGFAERVVQVFENTLNLNLSLYFSEPVVDLAIIDACHDTEYVINDFLKVEPFVRSGGIVLCHDTSPSVGPGHLFGSYMACMKLRHRGYNIRHIKDTWWGAWIKDSSIGRVLTPKTTGLSQ
jgi:predicted O-methyltransferase YrrM